jgi:hypothetical protein
MLLIFVTDDLLINKEIRYDENNKGIPSYQNAYYWVLL